MEERASRLRWFAGAFFFAATLLFVLAGFAQASTYTIGPRTLATGPRRSSSRQPPEEEPGRSQQILVLLSLASLMPRYARLRSLVQKSRCILQHPRISSGQ